MDLGRLGIWSWQFIGRGVPGADEAVAELEELGYGALWIPGGVSGTVMDDMARALDASTRLVVASGILNVWMHQADQVAAEHAALTGRHPGRVLLGIGVSHAPLIDSAERTYARPMAVITGFLDALDAASTPVPVSERVLAALGPRMLELARVRSAGAHPYLANPEHTARCREALGAAALLAPEQMVVLDDDLDRVRSIGRTQLAGYLRLPNYTDNLRRLGYGDDDFLDGGSDRLVDDIVVGGLDRISRRVDDHLAAGADHVCLQVLSEAPDRGAGPPGMPRVEWRELATLIPSLG